MTVLMYTLIVLGWLHVPLCMIILNEKKSMAATVRALMGIIFILAAIALKVVAS